MRRYHETMLRLALWLLHRRHHLTKGDEIALLERVVAFGNEYVSSHSFSHMFERAYREMTA